MEKIRLKNNKEYELATNGVSEFNKVLHVKVVSNSIEEVMQDFSEENCAELKIMKGEEIVVLYRNYTALGNTISLSKNVEIKSGESSRMVNIVSFSILEQGINEKVDKNRADIDYLMMMGEEA